MSTARRAFLQRLRGAHQAAQHKQLLSAAGADVASLESARLLRNGLAVTAFACFEGFIAARLREVSSWINSQSLPTSQIPETLRVAARKRAPVILVALLERDRESNDPQIDVALKELGHAWADPAGGAWTLPHVALIWRGSNLSSQTLVEILTLFGVISEWSSLAPVSVGAGFSVQATSLTFQEIADRRHKAAHRADHDTDVVLLRSTPDQLMSLGYAFDALLSSAARQIATGLPLVTGQAAVSQHALEQDSGDALKWVHRTGHAKDPNAQLAELEGDFDTVLTQVRSTLHDPRDILIVRRWEDGQHVVDSWHSMGV